MTCFLHLFLTLQITRRIRVGVLQGWHPKYMRDVVLYKVSYEKWLCQIAGLLVNYYGGDLQNRLYIMR